jgi:hypothetical protein
MATLPFLQSYAGQSLDQLLAMETSHRVDSLVLAIEQALSSRTDLNDAEVVVMSVEALEREVNNGGFQQFFANSSREHASHVVFSLQRIGCPKTAAIAQRAIDALGLVGPVTPDAIEDAICQDDDARYAILEECDAAYYQGEEEPIADKLFAFVRAERLSIRVGPANAP